MVVAGSMVVGRVVGGELRGGEGYGGEQMGARTLFAAMPRVGEPAYDAHKEMLNIIHDRGEGEGRGL